MFSRGSLCRTFSFSLLRGVDRCAHALGCGQHGYHRFEWSPEPDRRRRSSATLVREPHPKHGTMHHIINLIVWLQLLTILLSRGNVDTLGEAYAFRVVWSFAMKALAVVILRFTHPDAKRWKVPLNLIKGRFELPIGLCATTAMLCLTAIVNLFTKKTATISGVIFTVLFFTLFTWSERKYARQKESARILGNPHPDDLFKRPPASAFVSKKAKTSLRSHSGFDRVASLLATRLETTCELWMMCSREICRHVMMSLSSVSTRDLRKMKVVSSPQNVSSETGRTISSMW